MFALILTAALCGSPQEKLQAAPKLAPKAMVDQQCQGGVCVPRSGYSCTTTTIRTSTTYYGGECRGGRRLFRRGGCAGNEGCQGGGRRLFRGHRGGGCCG